MTILIVDDNEDMVAMMRIALQRGGFKVIEAGNGVGALRLFDQYTPRLIVSDVMMPEMDGYELLRLIRLRSKTPMLMVTGDGSPQGEVYSLEEGADDYIQKPFSGEQLLARVKAILRRSGTNTHIIKRGPLMLDKIERHIACDGNTLKLSPLEFQLLSALMEHPRHVFTREELYESVWGKSFEGNSRAVDTTITTLRRKLDKRDYLIETIHGVGYQLDV